MLVKAAGFCVYVHRIAGAVLYVGKGRPYRALETTRRNAAWVAAVAAAGAFEVEILSWHHADEGARLAEAEAIRTLRPTANMMLNGWHRSDDFRKQTGDRFRGKAKSILARSRMSAAAIARAPREGRPLTLEHKAKLRASARKTSVVEINSGVPYESISAACRSLSLHKGDVLKNLAGGAPVKGNVFRLNVLRLGWSRVEVATAALETEGHLSPATARPHPVEGRTKGKR